MFEGWNERIKKLTVLDIGFIKWSALVFGIIVAKIFPQLLNIRYSILIIIMLIFAAKPAYKFFSKK